MYLKEIHKEYENIVTALYKYRTDLLEEFPEIVLNKKITIINSKEPFKKRWLFTYKYVVFKYLIINIVKNNKNIKRDILKENLMEYFNLSLTNINKKIKDSLSNKFKNFNRGIIFNKYKNDIEDIDILLASEFETNDYEIFIIKSFMLKKRNTSLLNKSLNSISNRNMRLLWEKLLKSKKQ